MAVLEFRSAITQEVIDEARSTALVLPPREDAERELRSARRGWALERIYLAVAAFLGGALLALLGWMDTVGGMRIPGPGYLYSIAGVILFLGSPFWLFINLFRAFELPQPREPAEVAALFYSELIEKKSPRWHVAYSVLAPVALKVPNCTSVSKFVATWEAFPYTVAEAVKNQIRSRVSCSVCTKKASSGLWGGKLDRVPVDRPGEGNTFFGIWSSREFFFCEKCGALYCSECFQSLEGRGDCVKCGARIPRPSMMMRLATHGHGRPGASLTVVLSARRGVTRVLNLEQENLANVMYDIQYSLKCGSTPPRPEAKWVDFRQLMETDTVTCHLYNTAVRIGDSWRLLAGGHGRLAEG